MPDGLYPVMFLVAWVVLTGVFQRVGRPKSPREHVVAILLAALIALALIPLARLFFWIAAVEAHRHGLTG